MFLQGSTALKTTKLLTMTSKNLKLLLRITNT